MFCEDWWCFLQTVSTCQSCPLVCLGSLLPLLFSWRNEKVSEGTHRAEWLDAQIWSATLAPSLAIYLIPLGLSFLCIIINNNRSFLKNLCLCQALFQSHVNHQAQGQTDRDIQCYYHYFVMGQRAEGKFHPKTNLSVFPLQHLCMKIFSHIMAVNSFIISTARKCRKLITSILFFASSFETILLMTYCTSHQKSPQRR